MKKLFKSKLFRDNSAGTATTVEVSDREYYENDSTILSSPNGTFDSDDNGDNNSNMTQQTNNTKKKGHGRLFLKKKMSKLDSIREARGRAAKLLEPPPFTASKMDRLHELKEAKLRAEERIEERSRGGGSTSSVVSTISMKTWGTKGTVGTLGTLMEADEEQPAKQNALLFIAYLLLHMALLPFRNNTLFPLILLALQAICLKSLLNSLLVYSFDNIDFGQMELVKNMNHAKRLFVEEVQKYSLMTSVLVAVASCAISFGRTLMHSTAYGLCSVWESHRMCSFADVDIAPWTTQAFRTSTFVTSRLGVFVIAALLLGHLLLPKPVQKSNEKDVTGGKIRRASNHSHSGIQREKKKPATVSWSVSFLLATIATAASATSSPLSSKTNSPNAIQSILVAGSLNADTFLPIHRFPSPGENLTLLPNCQPLVDVPGGKGCNQAIACAKLSQSSDNTKVFFLGQFGNDAASTILQNALVDNNVDISSCGYSKLYPSGRGYVMIVPDTGEVSAVVSGGSNLYGWKHWGVKNDDSDATNQEDILMDLDIQDIVSSHSLLLLQCEVPYLVNLRLAKAAHKLNIPVIVDVGGEDRGMERDLLECCDYLVPNETELERLTRSYQNDGEQVSNVDDLDEIQAQIGPSLHLPTIINYVQTLQNNGASNVLVTLGSRGSILVKKQRPAFVSSPSILYQPACHLPKGSGVVDETGAGDCYRAGFAVALLEHCKGSLNDDDVDDTVLQQCMKLASAAGALAVTKKGAVPSIPSRREVEELLTEANEMSAQPATTLEAIPRGGDDDDTFPFLFGSRINSMKDRLDLVDPSSLPLATPHDYLKRQATIRGLGCVDFNFPQHFGDYWTPQDAKKALDEVGLVAGAVCLRYPSKFARGAMIHPDAEMRREAIEITKQAAEAARIMGCNEVVVWSAYDGYDYPFQVSYQEKWEQIVLAFQECCDAYPDIKWSLEYKPTDENTRFFTVASTGAAVLLVKEIDRPNMGLTLDMGHMLMSGENPGQSIAMAGEKLFGIQLNDGYTRLAAEDGMMFGSIHPSIALETMYQLRKINFSGHLYFDTFPQRTDPVKEAEYNIKRVKEFWMAVMKMDENEVERIAKEHDAIGALELVNEALRR